MSIKKLIVSNFKSFNEMEIELNNFNVLIGANASGKSNFVHIFEFLRDIVNHGLTNALSMQGGIEYLRNMNIKHSKNLIIKFISDANYGFLTRGEKIDIRVYETEYEFSLNFNERNSGFTVAKDILLLKCNFIKVTVNEKNLKEEKILGKGKIKISRVKNNLKVGLIKPEKVHISEDDIFSPLILPENMSSKTLILERPFSYFFMPKLEDIIANTSLYDFDPKLPKKATPITGKAELEENGSNLSIILKNITENNEKRKKLFNLVRDLLPFIKDLGVEKFADKSLLFKLQETYFENQFLPASLISDGTINITALIVALYFEKKPLTIIEEPERNIHPYLISKVMDMMKDVSPKKQIIVTTHSPEVVKYADINNILLVSRDSDGFSKIIKPANKKEIKTFLKNDIGIEELYIQNLLEE